MTNRWPYSFSLFALISCYYGLFIYSMIVSLFFYLNILGLRSEICPIKFAFLKFYLRKTHENTTNLL